MVKSEKRKNILIFTGRGATQCLIELADSVSGVFPIKHALTDGVSAREGVEF